MQAETRQNKNQYGWQNTRPKQGDIGQTENSSKVVKVKNASLQLKKNYIETRNQDWKSLFVPFIWE